MRRGFLRPPRRLRHRSGGAGQVDGVAQTGSRRTAVHATRRPRVPIARACRPVMNAESIPRSSSRLRHPGAGVVAGSGRAARAGQRRAASRRIRTTHCARQPANAQCFVTQQSAWPAVLSDAQAAAASRERATDDEPISYAFRRGWPPARRASVPSTVPYFLHVGEDCQGIHARLLRGQIRHEPVPDADATAKRGRASFGTGALTGGLFHGSGRLRRQRGMLVADATLTEAAGPPTGGPGGGSCASRRGGACGGNWARAVPCSPTLRRARR
jgi:hypothetical protein